MMANTVIFKWNPAISSCSMHQFLEEILDEDGRGDWSVHDYERIHAGDIFYMLKVGKGQTGIVKRGGITTDPVTDEDWSRQGRVTYYCDYEAEIMINPDTFSLLTSEQLQEAIPDFDWFGGHSGVVLNEDQAAKLETLWHKYLMSMIDEFCSRSELIERRDNMVNDQIYIALQLDEKILR